MKVIDPKETAQTLKIIPRYYPIGILDLYITEEGTGMTFTNLNISYIILDGVMSFTLDGEYPENNKYQILIKEVESVVYRGRAISTSQNPQDYKITKSTYVY